MNTPQIFNFEQNEVWTFLENDEPYLVGKDVAEVLGYANSRKALNDHIDPEDKLVLTSLIVTLENMPNLGLMKSTNRAFTHWRLKVGFCLQQ